MTDQAQLLDKLAERGLLDEEQIQHVQARAEQENITPEQIIRLEKLVFPEPLAQVMAELTGYPYVDLSSLKVNPQAMQDVARKAATTYRFIPFDIKDDKLLIAMEDPTDFQAQEAIKFIAKRRGLNPELYIASAAGIENAFGGSSTVQAEIGGAIKEFSQELEDAGAQLKKGGDDLEKIMEEAPVTKVVAVLIRHAIEGHASDIHIEPTEKDLRVRFRIDGQLHTSLVLPLKVHSAVISRVKILSNLKIDESRLPQDGRFSANIEGKAYDFRVSTMPTTFGEKAALRILDKSTGAPSFEELGFRGPMAKIFTEHLAAPHGIILISGPTGAGKSTTLYTALTHINKTDINIVTLEDPVEYEIEGINQTQTKPDIGLTFANGLRSILRQDPDVIMVGEIRDRETAELAIHAALTGHLVLSTIHTNNALGAMPRLIDLGIDAFLLSASLRLVAAQRLVGKLCQHCLQEKPLSEAMQEKIQAALEGVPEEYFITDNQKHPRAIYASEGCPQCHERGLTGRLAIFEMAPISRSIRDAMNEDGNYDTIQDIASREGMVTMRQDGILKALAGEVQFEDVLRATAETNNT